MGQLAEEIRRTEAAAINAATVEELPKPHWTTDQLQEEFEVIGFAAPYVVVQRKSDGKKGSLTFKHQPRIYFNWEPTSV